MVQRDRVARLAAHRTSEPSASGLARLLRELADPDSGVGARDLLEVGRLDGGIATATHRLRVADSRGHSVDLVLKRYLVGDDTVGLEWDRLSFAAHRAGVATPAPVLVDLDGTWFGTPALVMTALPGAVRYDVADPAGWVSALAQTLAEIHRSDVSPPVPAAVRRTPAWRSLDPAGLPEPWRSGPRGGGVTRVVERLRRVAPDLPEVLCHGDFHPGNVLFDDAGVSGVVDWSAARLEPAEADVSNTRAELALIADHLPGLFTAAYLDARGVTLKVLPLWDVLAAVAMTVWMPYVGDTVNEGSGVDISRAVALTRLEAFLDDALGRAGPEVD
ncbi:phosphotransferase [Actinopolymorpha pittospori]|uniref:Ser/Thr protein kinase RdoA (MazF antagonist) n=1 Tax=Actinopolymorpha pittospori TaxID=648752 RepID=A0A927R953_9ACTN|nr:Ser/Thr protein kinase RdoA (MazF antagonist) [Actinopolymorpha pittospori]